MASHARCRVQLSLPHSVISCPMTLPAPTYGVCIAAAIIMEVALITCGAADQHLLLTRDAWPSLYRSPSLHSTTSWYC